MCTQWKCKPFLINCEYEYAWNWFKLHIRFLFVKKNYHPTCELNILCYNTNIYWANIYMQTKRSLQSRAFPDTIFSVVFASIIKSGYYFAIDFLLLYFLFILFVFFFLFSFCDFQFWFEQILFKWLIQFQIDENQQYQQTNKYMLYSN